MKKFLLVLAIGFQILLLNHAEACTTFFLQKNGQMVFGRNYDWVTAKGTIQTNLRGLAKTSFPMDKGRLINWVSKYGSTTFNQYGKEFPNGGINEKGLVVELMWLNESRYPDADARAGVNVLQWIQFQLDNCATIGEVIESDKKIRIIPNGTPQHYLVADANGQAATIEFLNGKMIVHTGKDLPFPVLANSTYQQSVKAVGTASASGNKQVAAFQDNSIHRFTKACSMINTYTNTNNKKSLVNYSFDILDEVAQGDFTKWSIVYDISNRKIYFKTAAFQQVKSVDLSSFNYACTSKPLSMDMNQDFSGNITGRFVNYSPDQNTRTLVEAFKESKTHVQVPDHLVKAVAAYPQGIKCGSAP